MVAGILAKFNIDTIKKIISDLHKGKSPIQIIKEIIK